MNLPIYVIAGMIICFIALFILAKQDKKSMTVTKKQVIFSSFLILISIFLIIYGFRLPDQFIGSVQYALIFSQIMYIMFKLRHGIMYPIDIYVLGLSQITIPYSLFQLLYMLSTVIVLQVKTKTEEKQAIPVMQLVYAMFCVISLFFMR